MTSHIRVSSQSVSVRTSSVTAHRHRASRQSRSQDSDMEEPVKEHPSAASGSARPKLQRYALRSVTKSKEDAHDSSNSSDSKRGRTAASLSKSVGVLDLSGKDKSGSGKPPRRQSIPAKTTSATPGRNLAAAGNITPISETRTRRSSSGQGRSETPISDTSKTSSRTKFNLITSASYWLNQIKLSESAAKHSVSLGFFKLALEAGCEPFQRMQEGLKSYVRRHELGDLGETMKELFESYDIKENIERQQVSETISQMPEEGTRSSDDDVHSSSSSMGTRKLKPKCLNIDPTQLTPAAAESTKRETSQKGHPGSRLRANSSTNSPNPRPALGSGNRRSVKKPEKLSKQELSKKKGMVRKHGKKSNVKEVPGSTPQGNKENMEALTNEEINMTEVVQTSS